VPTELPDGTNLRKLNSSGTFKLDKVTYLVGGQHGFHHVLINIDGDTITVINREGEILAEHTRPAPGITYVGNGRPPGPRARTSETPPKS